MKRLTVLFIPAALVLLANFISAQDIRTAEDGFPVFSNTNYDAGLAIVFFDSADVLMLQPETDTLVFKQPNGWTLSGIQWQYNNSDYNTVDQGYLNHAIDVDNISYAFPGRTAYLISDLTQNKVFVREPSVMPGISFFYNNPDHAGLADADFEVDGANLKSVLITYKATDTVLRVDYDFRNILWSFGGAGVLSSPSDAESISGRDSVLIADTGRNRVILVNATTNAVEWSYEGPGNGFNPVDVEPVGNSQVLITDQSNHRVLLVNMPDTSIVWQFGTGSAGNSNTALRLPSDADWVADGQMVLIADKGNNRIIEVSTVDSTYFYQWPNPSFEIEDVDAETGGGFLVAQREIIDAKNVWLPTHLAFSPPAADHNEIPLVSRDSVVTDLNGQEKEVDFQTIIPSAHNTSATTIRYQFRSARLRVPIRDEDEWRGPDGTMYSFYDSTEAFLFSGHKPHTSGQFGAFLTTTDPRQTPKIDSVSIIYNSYPVNQPGVASLNINTPIGAAMNAPVSVAWDTLTLFWKPASVEQRDFADLQFRLTLRHAETQNIIYRDTDWRSPSNGQQNIVLSNLQELRGIKQITFSLELATLNSGLSPQLDGWRFTWREIVNAPPAIQFADSSFTPKNFYTATQYIPAANDSIFVDQVFLRLSNVLEPEDTLTVSIMSPQTGDSVSHVLVYDPVNLIYHSQRGTPITLLADRATPATNGDDTLQLLDRDSLVVEFQSAQRPGEILADSIMAVQGTIGRVFIQDINRTTISTAELTNELHVRVENEMDRNLNPVLQDSISLLLQNDMTSDTEIVTLYEEDNDAGIYNSGIFISENPVILAMNANSGPNDGILFSRRGDRISAQYPDNFKKMPTYRFITIPVDTPLIESALDLECLVAPNPYRQRDGANFRMRVRSGLGPVAMQKIEIYNFAGEKVKETDGAGITFAEVYFATVSTWEYTSAGAWWNLLNDSGQQIASGTYWVKLEAVVGGNLLTARAKFVVVR